jgi:hypothetical protein
LTNSIFLSCSSEEDVTKSEENSFEDISKMGQDELFINLFEENERIVNQITNPLWAIKTKFNDIREVSLLRRKN